MTNMHEKAEFSHLICNLLTCHYKNEKQTLVCERGIELLLNLEFLFVLLQEIYKGETIHCLNKTQPS